MILDQFDLRCRDAQQRHDHTLTDEPVAEFPPNLGFQHRVDAGLLGQCIRIEQTQGMILDVRLRPEERAAQQPRRHTGGTVVVEGFF